MKNFIQFAIYFLLTTSISMNHSFAQAYIWGGPGDKNSEFNGGLNDWTTKAIKPNDSAIWVWEADGKADKGKWWYGSDAIKSPSVENGAAVFDSDYYATGGPDGDDGEGSAPYPQTSELISPAFSCEEYESVWIQFNQYYRTWKAKSKIAVSIDNGETWVYEEIVNEDIKLNNSTNPNSKKLINISHIAAHQAEVKIKFIWDGGYYFWIIDDVYIISNPKGDPQITGTWFPPSGFEIPKEIITHDSLKFKMEIINKGGQDIDNILGTVSILNTGTYKSYYTDSVYFSSIAGDTMDIDFNSFVFTPDIDTGLYVAVYSIYADSTETEENKSYFQFFHVGGNNINNSGSIVNWEYSLCDKQADFSYSYQGNSEDGPKYSVMHINIFKTGDWTENPDIKFTATHGFLSVWMRTDENLISFPVTVYFFNLNDTINDNLSNFNFHDGIITDGNPSFQLKYIGYAVENIENVEKSKPVYFPLYSAQDDDYIKLEPSKTIFMAASWPKGTRIYQTVDNNYNGIKRYHYPDQIKSLRYADYGDGAQFYSISRDIGAWQMGFKSKFAVTTKENSFPENTVSFKSNPVKNDLGVNIDFNNTVSHATMVIHNLNGDIIDIRNIYNIKNTEQHFYVGNLPTGMYIFTIFTKDKLLSKKFLVQK